MVMAFLSTTGKAPRKFQGLLTISDG